jgi:hypothetical protein
VGGTPPPDAPSPDPAPRLGPEPTPRASQELVDLVREVESVRSGPAQAALNEIRERTQSGEPREGSVGSAAATPSLTVSRLFFQCTDDITFAVRSIGRRLEVFQPAHSNDYIVLAQQPSDSDLCATSRDAEFRMDGELATLQVGRDRYVDCVSNPAAALWQEPPRGR